MTKYMHFQSQQVTPYQGNVLQHLLNASFHFHQVEQTDILPKEMVFSVKEFPRLGHVVKLINDSKILDYIQSFTQEDINMGRIVYVSTSLQGKDHFAADVSNGFTTVENVEVQVEIVPRLIPVQVVNLTVREGGSVALTQEVLNITHPFYRQFSVDFIMEEEPQHGDIRYLEDEDGVVSFTWAEVSPVLNERFT